MALKRSDQTKYELSGCSICGSKDVEEIADREELKRETERVWSFHARRLRHPVPPEYLTDRLIFSQAPPLRLVRCTVCTHVYRRPHESPETIRRAYAEAPLSDSVYESLFENQRLAYRAQVHRLRKFAGRINRGLEVGSYMGGFLAAARDAGMSFTGIDVNPASAAHGSRQRLHISTCSLEEVPSSETYDAIAIWNTFEQLPDVRSAAHASRRLLRNGGVLAVRVPNAEFYVRWRRRLKGPLGWWAERALVHNNLLGFPFREGFTSRSLGRLLEDAGFSIGEVHGDTLVPVADRWTRTPAVLDEWLTKKIQRIMQHGWRAPWVEVYARAQ
ncbi:MAG TPA: class I SAM-dependent methyltransferase [Gemmatimonadaceae bacterium]|nr:class I SAM-dependent methyltransferase [Gemmatimonadaceae bacterium]